MNDSILESFLFRDLDTLNEPCDGTTCNSIVRKRTRADRAALGEQATNDTHHQPNQREANWPLGASSACWDGNPAAEVAQ